MGAASLSFGSEEMCTKACSPYKSILVSLSRFVLTVSLKSFSTEQMRLRPPELQLQVSRIRVLLHMCLATVWAVLYVAVEHLHMGANNVHGHPSEAISIILSTLIFLFVSLTSEG